jgi:hypothetical protein
MESTWLLLLHQIPPSPPYFRAKVVRRLAQVGALPLKNSAYVLPDTEDALEDFQWICREVIKLGGGAWLFRCEALAGMTSEEIRQSFRDLRSPDYEALIEEARVVRNLTSAKSDTAEAAYIKLCRQNETLRRIDFFNCPGRTNLQELMTEIEELRSAKDNWMMVPVEMGGKGKIWVTRKDIRVDRIGSAWLIRRFIDPQASFRFVTPNDYVHKKGEIRFDMFEGEFTHTGDRCTFEALVHANDLGADAALVALAEIVHDIDLKDQRYQRPETIGLARLINGMCLRVPTDAERLERGAIIFDSLYQGLAEAAKPRNS